MGFYTWVFTLLKSVTVQPFRLVWVGTLVALYKHGGLFVVL